MWFRLLATSSQTISPYASLECLLLQVMRAFGPLSVFYFLSVMFIGTYFVLNLILGIVSMAFEESQNQENIDEKHRLQGEENERMRREEEEEEAGRKGEVGEDGSLVGARRVNVLTH